MTGGEAVQALELVLRPERDADLLVVVSHEGETPLTLEAARAWRGPTWLVTGTADGPIAELCDEVVVCTPAIEESWCHTASYTCAVAAIAALHGEDIGVAAGRGRGGARGAVARGGGAGAVPRRGRGPRSRDRARGGAEAARGRVGRGRGVRDGAAPARLPRRGRRVGARVRPRRRRALRRSARPRPPRRCAKLGCEVDLLPTRHPVVDIVPFQRLTVEIAERRGREPDRIRRHDPRWIAAAAAAKADNAA